jgi:hypothetical protein
MPWRGHGAGPSSARRSALQEGQNGCGELGGVVFLYEVPGVGDDLNLALGNAAREFTSSGDRDPRVVLTPTDGDRYVDLG